MRGLGLFFTGLVLLPAQLLLLHASYESALALSDDAPQALVHRAPSLTSVLWLALTTIAVRGLVARGAHGASPGLIRALRGAAIAMFGLAALNTACSHPDFPLSFLRVPFSLAALSLLTVAETTRTLSAQPAGAVRRWWPLGVALGLSCVLVVPVARASFLLGAGARAQATLAPPSTEQVDLLERVYTAELGLARRCGLSERIAFLEEASGHPEGLRGHLSATVAWSAYLDERIFFDSKRLRRCADLFAQSTCDAPMVQTLGFGDGCSRWRTHLWASNQQARGNFCQRYGSSCAWPDACRPLPVSGGAFTEFFVDGAARVGRCESEGTICESGGACSDDRRSRDLVRREALRCDGTKPCVGVTEACGVETVCKPGLVCGFDWRCH